MSLLGGSKVNRTSEMNIRDRKVVNNQSVIGRVNNLGRANDILMRNYLSEVKSQGTQDLLQ